MDAGPLHMLHDAGDQNVLPVEHAVHLHLPAHQVFVHQDGVFLLSPVDDLHELHDVAVVIGDLHPLSAQHIGGTHQHGIAHLVGGGQRLFGGKDRLARGPGNPALLEDLVEPLPVLGGVHAVGGGAQDGHAHVGEGLGQLDGGLAAELDHRPPGLLQLHHSLHVLGRQGLEVQLVGHVKVGGDGLGVIVDDDGLIAQALEGPDRMDRAVVKLDALANADGPGAQHQHLPLLPGRLGAMGLALAGGEIGCSGNIRRQLAHVGEMERFGGLVFRVVGGVVIGGLGLELSGAGVHHLEGGHKALPLPQGLDLRPLLPRQGGDPGVGEAHLLGLPEGIRVQPAALQPVLHIHDILEPVQEPQVVLGDFVDLLRREAPAQRLGHNEQPLIVDVDQPVLDVLGIQLVQSRQAQGLDGQLQ